jgi:hypothetical protein
MNNTLHPACSSSSSQLLSRVIALLMLQPTEMPLVDEGTHRGPRRKIQDWQIIAGLVIHALGGQGSLASHIALHLRLRISDAALSFRRQKMTLQPFFTILRHALRPLAQEDSHPGCFFKGLRLVGHDGTQLSLSNTEAVLKRMTKAATRRGKAAFAKMGLSTLVELATHNPLAAAIGLDGQSENALFGRVLKELPRRCLLILDRLHGNAPVLDRVQSQCQASDSAFLIRVRKKLAVKVLKSHADGSAEVEVKLYDKVKKRQVNKWLKVREVRAWLQRRRDGNWVEVRLWTSLSPEQASAEEIVALYARRWEQEIFYKELKMGLRNGDLLLSQTPETAAQEVAALLMASSLVAEERLACAAESENPEVSEAGVLRISHGLCLELTTALWVLLAIGEDLMDGATQAEFVRRARRQIAELVLPKRRSRTCDRKVRQPVRKWPRMINPISVTSETLVSVEPIT